MTGRFATMLLLAALFSPAGAGAAEYERVPAGDPAFDRNGDGFQDVIVLRRKVHYDVDFDGKFDYTLVLKFSEYTDEGHGKYLASGFDGNVFEEITMKGLDSLCATDREKAKWIEDNFTEYPFYHDGYSALYVFSDSAANDGRLVSPKEKGEYEYLVSFNPDGSVRTVRQGDAKVTVTEFDYETNTGGERKVFLRKIESAGDLDAVREEVKSLLAGPAQP